MAAGPITQISDVVVPEIFTSYIQQLTEEKSRIIQSGIMTVDDAITSLLAGGGLTFNVPSYKDLDNDEERVSTDTAVDDFTGGTARPDPNKIGTATEVAVRLSRNNSWSSADLTSTLAGSDPMAAIANRVSDYWARRLQAACVATVNGVVADNTTNDSGDYTNDVSGSVFADGVTNFTTESFIDTALTLGDSMDKVTSMVVHSVVFARMQKNNLIDFIPDARGEVSIPTFLGRQVIIDDGVPFSGSVYETWLFGSGFLRYGRGIPKVPTEIEREAGGGNGGGQEILYNRVEWAIHPQGHAYTGTAPNGGPSNAATTNNLADAGSWNRVYTERKQIPFARMVTRES